MGHSVLLFLNRAVFSLYIHKLDLICFPGLGEPPPEPVPIPELSAAEERAEARSWRSVVVAGLERRIDMKVIEPYKRVLI